MRIFEAFFIDGVRLLFKGSGLYWGWVSGLLVVVVIGLISYNLQLRQGLMITGMTDQVSWGFYIANFTFLVGVAAAAVMLVIPAYLFQQEDVKQAVILGEGIAVAAVVTCILFVTADLGRPDRLWHLIPLLGSFNFPLSLLAWDMVVLTGYLLLNLGLPVYILFIKYKGQEPILRRYFPVVVITIIWAISIHTVTAFLFSANVARPFWNTAVLAPRFLASAFASGPALIILVLQLVDRLTELKVSPRVIDLLRIIVTVSMQIHLFMIGVEVFTDLYNQAEHSASLVYLLFGLREFSGLVPWIWSSLGLSVVAVTILSLYPFQKKLWLLNLACVLTVVGIWIEKGMGLVIPGFIPTPVGEIVEYLPTAYEVLIALGILSCGMLVLTLLLKVAIPIDRGHVKYRYTEKTNARPVPQP